MSLTIKKRRSSYHKTPRKRSTSLSGPMSAASGFKEQLVIKFLVILNMVKLYHWKTHNYAAHKASDDLYSSFNENMDKFVEVLLGKLDGARIELSSVKNIPLIDFHSGNTFDEKMKREITKFKSYLVNLNNEPTLKKISNTDLWNIRDEILASLNQFLYLLSLNR